MNEIARLRSKVRRLVKMGSPFYLFALLLFGCGDFWEASEPQSAGTMTLPRKAVTLMVGDKYKIPVVFEPDSLSNHQVWWSVEYASIVSFSNDSVVGVNEGLSWVYAVSVSDRLMDSCLVNVLPTAYVNPHQYPYDMVIYADVTVHGKKYTKADEDSLLICAYSFDELRGIGKMREWNGKPYMEIRIWNPFRDSGKIALRCYYRGKALVEQYHKILDFDGETHGSLSDLYPLNFDSNAEEYIPSEDNTNIIQGDTITI